MDVYDNCLAVFEPAKIEAGILKIEYVRYSPVGNFTSKNSPLIFEIPADGARYLDLKKSVLNVSFKILKKDGSELTSDAGKGDLVSVVNLPLSSIFRQTDISLNHTPIAQSVGGNHPYRCYLDVILNSTKQQEETLLQSQLFYKDQGEEIHAAWLSNYGFTKRLGYGLKSRICTIRGRLITDISDQKNLILPGVKLGVKLYQAEDFYRLMSDSKDTGNYMLQITDAFYDICQVTVDPRILLGHVETLKSEYALYPIQRSDMKTYNMQKGAFSFSIDNVYQGSVPTKMVLTMCSSESFHGSKHQNPYNFEHMDTSYVEVMVDGISRPRCALTPDFKNDEYTEAFSTLYASNEGSSGLIEMKDYAEGYCIYVFELGPHCGSDVMAKPKTGNVHVNLKFSKALPYGMTLILYSKFTDMIRIDSARNVYTGF